MEKHGKWNNLILWMGKHWKTCGSIGKHWKTLENIGKPIHRWIGVLLFLIMFVWLLRSSKSGRMILLKYPKKYRCNFHQQNYSFRRETVTFPKSAKIGGSSWDHHADVAMLFLGCLWGCPKHHLQSPLSQPIDLRANYMTSSLLFVSVLEILIANHNKT